MCSKHQECTSTRQQPVTAESCCAVSHSVETTVSRASQPNNDDCCASDCCSSTSDDGESDIRVVESSSPSSAPTPKLSPPTSVHGLTTIQLAKPIQDSVPTLGQRIKPFHQSQQSRERRQEQDREVTQKLSWYVLGMDCPACAKKVENAVSKVTGVGDAKVLFATEKLVVSVDPVFESNASKTNVFKSDIENAITEAGFSFSHQRHNLAASNSNSESVTLIAAVVQRLIPYRFILAIALTMLIAAVVETIFPRFSSLLFAATCLVGMVPIVKKAWQLAKTGTPFSIETLMSVAALGALYLGETVEAAMVLLLFLIGEKLEAYAASRARSGVQALMELMPETATKMVAGQKVVVAASELTPEDVIEVSPGDRLPADGVLLDQAVSLDESALTGESVPVDKAQGDRLMAGSVVVDRVVQMSVTSAQGDNAIDRILHLIEEAESRKAPLERFLDKFSRWYTPLMMLISLLVIVTPPLLFAQPWETWLYRGLALLLIACPCALVISTPAAITSGLASAAKRGALIKGGAALEQLGRIDIVAFDKTGTLTEGKPSVTDVVSLDQRSEMSLLEQVAAIEVGSNHPLAQALVKEAQRRGIEVSPASNRQALVGVGVQGEYQGRCYRAMAPSKVETPISGHLQQQIHELESQGKTAVIVFEEQQPVGLIAWQDTLRDEAAQAIAGLKALGVGAVMLTGDNPTCAAAMASRVGMDYQAGLLPQDKVSHVEALAAQQQVAMVGDGINDAPAMKSASIGIAMGGGTDVALETADAALTHNRLVELPAMIALSRATLNNIRQNVALALGLKGIFLVTSLFGITGLWMAVLADSGATALVTLNALRLLRFEHT